MGQSEINDRWKLQATFCYTNVGGGGQREIRWYLTGSGCATMSLRKGQDAVKSARWAAEFFL